MLAKGVSAAFCGHDSGVFVGLLCDYRAGGHFVQEYYPRSKPGKRQHVIFRRNKRGRACFTVYADKTVEFRHGDKTYGPYTVREDASAVTKAIEAELGVGEPVAGIEFCKEGEILFRGGVVKHRDYIWLYNEDGSADMGWIDDFWPISDDILITDGNGNIIDQMEPGILTILNLMAGPELEHKGDWSMWFCGVFICVFTAVSILFVDELFRWHLSFRIRNVEQAEPSEWEMASRYLGWGLMVIVAAATFIEGLR